MLGKLIKHEFYATGKYFLPLYVLIIVFTPLLALINRLLVKQEDGSYTANSLMRVSSGVFGFLSIGGFAFLMIAIFIATFVLIVLRFYRTTATSEAYLTFTLPVKPWEILFAKTLSAFTWEICSGIMALLAVIAMVCISGLSTPGEIADFISDGIQILAHQELYSALTPVIILLAAVFGVFSSISMIYLAIMLGQLFNKNRVLISIAMYMAINVVLQFATSIITMPFLFIIGGTGSDNMAANSTYINLTYLFSCGENIIVAAVCLIVTGYIMNKRLNVQ